MSGHHRLQIQADFGSKFEPSAWGRPVLRLSQFQAILNPGLAIIGFPGTGAGRSRREYVITVFKSNGSVNSKRAPGICHFVLEKLQIPGGGGKGAKGTLGID